MISPNDDTVRSVLLDLLDRCYEKQSWHGPNLKGSVRGLSAQQVAWRPASGRHSIAEQVLHAAYWKYTVRRRLLNEPRGSFALAGSNWFTVDDCSEGDWRGFRTLLDQQHKLLRAAIVALPGARWDEVPRGSKFTFGALVMGIAQHDLYHAAQIQLLKRLQGA